MVCLIPYYVTFSEKMKKKKIGSPHPMARVPMASVTMARVPTASVPVELKCSAYSCDRGDGAPYMTPKLVSGLALDLLLKHRAENHPLLYTHQPPLPAHH